MTSNRSPIRPGSGNVFADLGLPGAEDLLSKARLASAIADAIETRGMTQAQAAALLGTSQPNVSSLVNGRLEGFSLDRLVRFLNALGQDVEITVTAAASGEAGATRVRIEP